MQPDPTVLVPDDPPARCDVAVVGAGIIGLATARELCLRDPGLRVAVFEREDAIARHQTGRSSGVIHSGIPYAPGSLKARLCVEGARELYAYCEESGIPARRDGKLIIATEPAELPRLDELERRGRANGVPGLRRVEADEIRSLEPHATGLAALHSPATGVVDFRAVAAALARDVRARGGTVSTGCAVGRIAASPHEARLRHQAGVTAAGAVVSCAGAWSDRLAVAAGAAADPRIVPFRGSFLRLRPSWAHLVRASIYPVPDPALPFLGAHLTRGSDGGVLLGPTALLVAGRGAGGQLRELASVAAWPGTWRLLARHRRAAARELHQALRPAALVARARRLVPALRPADFEPGPSGIRAQALARDGTLVDDFVVSRTQRCVHVRNAPSPAATAALSLARLIADETTPLLG